MLCWFTNVTDNTFTFYQSVAASNCFLGYLQFWKSFPSCPRFRSAEVKMAGGIISTDLAVTKMRARGRISRELTNLLKEPPLGCFANLKVFNPRMKRLWKGGSFVNPFRPWGGGPCHVFAYISVQMRERAHFKKTTRPEPIQGGGQMCPPSPLRSLLHQSRLGQIGLKSHHRVVQGGRSCAGARVAPAEKFGLGQKF